MFKLAVVVLAVIVCAAAKPSLIGAPLVYSASAALVAAPAPDITATSSQLIGHNNNGIATTPVIAPVTAPVIAAAFGAAPLTYGAPLTYSSPLTYAAGPAPVLW